VKFSRGSVDRVVGRSEDRKLDIAKIAGQFFRALWESSEKLASQKNKYNKEEKRRKNND